MSVHVDVPEARMGTVMADISGARRGTVNRFNTLQQEDIDTTAPIADALAIVEASVPLAELLGCVE